MRKFFLSAIIAFLLVLPIANAQHETSPAVAQAIEELKTVDIYFNFTSSIPSNTNYTMPFNFEPKDWGDKSKIYVALIRTVEEQVGAPTLYLWVNEEECNTPSISSTIGRAQYVADFDCTNIINDTGCYNVTFQSSLALANLHFRAWITYTTDLTNQTIEAHRYLINVFKFFEGTETDVLLSNHDYCVDDTLVKEIVTEKCGFLINETACINVTSIEEVVCTYGCDEERDICKEAPYKVGLWLFAGFLVFVIAMLIVLRLLRKI